ncbi:MAG: 30S ribosomal protein S27ae [Candidatus Bathyarchaeia archaeon]
MPKRKEKRFVSLYYKIEDGKLKRVLPICERCGPGYFMADHGNRYTCGHCGFTRYKTSPRNTSRATAREDNL